MLLKPAADNSRIALLVEKVQDVASCSETPRPLSESETLNGCVTGIVEIKGRPVHVLAADRLLLEAERQQLASLTSVAQKRLGAWDLAL
jgi:chemotaxis signal transduction protein